MIKTPRQLKDKIKNMSGGNSMRAQTLIRNYIMERFLERIALSEYKDKFVLKGGMLVASIVGLETRATMDIDTTVRSLNLTLEDATKAVEDISKIEIDDGVSFAITKATDIMEEHEYPGLRFMLEAKFDGMKQAIKIDISTGDAITPSAVMYSYKLMFEERAIPLYTYNIETLLAEKLETVMSRGAANTRMRDFYDIHVILEQERDNINTQHLHNAFIATARKRNTDNLISQIYETIDYIAHNELMERDWNNYRKSNFFVGELSWQEVVDSVKRLADMVLAGEEKTVQV